MVALQAHSAWGQRQAGKLPVGPVSAVLPWKPVALPVNPGLGQAGKTGFGAEILLPTALAAATAFVGFRLGKTDHGIPSVLGYITGTLAALAALGGVLMTLGVITNPLFIKAQLPTSPGTYPIS